MTKTKTTPPTPEQLRAQAEQLDAEAAQLRQELQRQADEERQRRHAAGLAWDEQYVAGFSRARVEADVDQAKAALDRALAENPLVLALADYLAALRRRSHAVAEHMSALNRLGRGAGPPNAGPTELANVDEYVIRSAERIASDRVAAELADLHASRDAAADTTEEN